MLILQMNNSNHLKLINPANPVPSDIVEKLAIFTEDLQIDIEGEPSSRDNLLNSFIAYTFFEMVDGHFDLMVEAEESGWEESEIYLFVNSIYKYIENADFTEIDPQNKAADRVVFNECRIVRDAGGANHEFRISIRMEKPLN